MGLAIWRSEAKYEDMMYISYRVTGGVKGLYTALNNENGHDCKGSDCGGDLVRTKKLIVIGYTTYGDIFVLVMGK